MTTSTLCTNRLLTAVLCSVLAVWVLTPAFIQLGENMIQASEQLIQNAKKSPQVHVQPSLCMTSAN
jgi:hypothetical protein